MYEMRNLLKDLNAEYVVSNKQYCVKGDGWEIDIFRDVIYNDSEWKWEVDGSIFSCDEWACSYLKKRIREKETGIRIIYQDHQELPDICGDGTYCKAENDNWKFSMLCSSCPKAHKYQADKDGLTIEYRPARIEKRKEFVEKCGELLRIAKPHLLRCEYRLGKEIQDKHYMPDEEYVLVTCENGAQYVLSIEANSLNAIAAEIFNSMAHK